MKLCQENKAQLTYKTKTIIIFFFWQSRRAKSQIDAIILFNNNVIKFDVGTLNDLFPHYISLSIPYKIKLNQNKNEFYLTNVELIFTWNTLNLN